MMDAVGAPCELRTSPRLAAWLKELLEGMHIFYLGIYVSLPEAFAARDG